MRAFPPVRSTAVVLVPFVLAAATGCSLVTTKEEGRAIQAELQKVSDRVAKIEGQLAEEQARLTAMIDRARADMEKLEETLTRATRILARNSADFGAEMESVKGKLREIDGSLAEVRHEVEESARRIVLADKKANDFARAAGVDLPVDESTIPAKPEGHYEMIKDAAAAGRYGELRSLCDVFLARYPTHALADDVQHAIARSYLDQKRWAKALGALRRFTEKYPTSDLLPEVLYEMADSFLNLGDCTDARILVEEIGARHAKSPFAEKARLLGEEMKKNKSRCTS